MPVYKVQAPNGKILRIEGPDGASQDQLVQAAKEYYDAAFQPSQSESQPNLVQKAGDQIVGAGETALASTVGAGASTLGMIGGALKGLAEQILSGEFGTADAASLVAHAAQRGSETLSAPFMPKTEAGKSQMDAIGELADPLMAVAPMAGSLSPLTEAAGPAANLVRGTVGPRIMGTAESAGVTLSKMEQPGVAAPSVGAMGTEQSAIRRTNAESLGFVDDKALTEGQATREFAQQQFEKETAKQAEVGLPLRERNLNQNAHISNLVDTFIESTGGEAPDLRSVGLSVDKALTSRATGDKARIKMLYKKAEEVGETKDKIDPTPVIDYLNENKSSESTAGIIKVARDEIVRLGGARYDEKGNLVPIVSQKRRPGRPPKTPRAPDIAGITLGDLEQMRQKINKSSGSDKTNMLFGSEIKKVIDSATEGKGGEFYAKARSARSKFSRDYEDVGLVNDLMGTKPGSSDRTIALENVFQQSIVSPSTSLDSMRHLKRLLMTKSEDGGQAWKDLQAATLQHIKDEITRGVARDERGNPLISPAKFDKMIKDLDKSGKLDYIFGPQGAEKIRTLNDVAKDVLVSVPNATNTSNTASVIMAAMDTVLSGTAGVPLPILTGFKTIKGKIRDNKLRARVAKALGEEQ